MLLAVEPSEAQLRIRKQTEKLLKCKNRCRKCVYKCIDPASCPNEVIFNSLYITSIVDYLVNFPTCSRFKKQFGSGGRWINAGHISISEVLQFGFTDIPGVHG